jgi:hypothetical protein
MSNRSRRRLMGATPGVSAVADRRWLVEVRLPVEVEAALRRVACAGELPPGAAAAAALRLALPRIVDQNTDDPEVTRLRVVPTLHDTHNVEFS